MHRLTGQECNNFSIQDITVHGLHATTKAKGYANVLECLHIIIQNLISFKTNLFLKNQICKMRETFLITSMRKHET